MSQASLFDEFPKVASVRKRDPRTAKTAAAADPRGRAYQRTLILRHLVEHGPATADELGRVIQRHRSVASSRLGVLRGEGLVEKCGLKDDVDEYGKRRTVELHRVTDAGRDAL